MIHYFLCNTFESKLFYAYYNTSSIEKDDKLEKCAVEMPTFFTYNKWSYPKTGKNETVETACNLPTNQ